MEMSQVVRSGPGQYISEAGSLRYLDKKLNIFNKPYIITGDQSFAAFQKFYKAEVKWPILKCDRTASHENMRVLAEQAGDADVIVGIGGGTVLDTAKGTAEMMNVQFIAIPTVAATCAAYTPIAAVYYPDHSFKCVDYYEHAAFLTLVDLDLLVASPKDYFLAGIGDTLAKWYEASGIVNNLPKDIALPAMARLGLAAAKETQEILLADTAQALADMSEGKVTPAFTRVVDTVIAMAGTVGGFAGEYGRMAGAHAVHNAMSYFSETHQILHGVKVAYGILVQLLVTNDQAEVGKLLHFYQTNAFVSNLAGLGLKQTDKVLNYLADFASSDAESFKFVKQDLSPEDIKKAIRELEEMQ